MLIKTNFYLPYNPNLKEKARVLRKNMTEEEKTIWENYLRNCKYTVNRQKIIDNYIVDFYCASKKLVIEIDGSQHYTEEGIAYDKERTTVLEGYGLTVIRFTNNEVSNKIEYVIERLKEYLD